MELTLNRVEFRLALLHTNTQFWQKHLLKSLFFNVYFQTLCQNSSGCSCVGLPLNLPLEFLDLDACFWASAMLVLLVWLYSRTEIQEWWHFPHCSFCLKFLWIILVFCASMLILRSYFLCDCIFAWEESCWNFNKYYIEPAYFFW